MKYKALILAVVALLLLTTLGFTENGQVTSVIGNVTYSNGNNNQWETVYRNMIVTPQMVIRVGADARCEITIGSTNVPFTRTAMYPMAPFLTNPANAERLIMNILARQMIEDGHSQVATVAGTRAADVAETHTNDILLLDDAFGSGDILYDAQYYLDLAEPDYEGALLSLTPNSIEMLSADKKAEGYFLRGWCLYQTFRYDEAIASLGNALAQDIISDEFKAQAMLFQSLSYSNQGNFDSSLEAAEGILENRALESVWEEAIILCATANLMLGNEADADIYFERLSREYPNSAMNID